MNFFEFLTQRYDDIGVALLQHIQVTFFAVFLAIIIGVPVGILITRYTNIAEVVINIANIFQTLPSLALFGLMLPLLGIGFRNAVFVLFLYALLPIIKNTYIGIRNVDDSIIEAAHGMGMTSMEILRIVEAPLALPVIMGGIRVSTVINIGTATIATFIGAGGLGDLIYKGIGMVDYNLIFAGAVPAALLALLADAGLGAIENKLTSPGLKKSS